MFRIVEKADVDVAALKAQIDLRSILTPGAPIKGEKPTSMRCLFHQETQGSMYVYPTHLHCYGCQAHMDIIDFVGWRAGLDVDQNWDRIIELISTDYLGMVPLPPPARPRKELAPLPRSVAEYLHSRLGRKRQWFHRRGINDETIDRELLGYDRRAFVIPVWSETGELVTLRYRRDDEVSEKGPKYWGMEGRNDVYLYNFNAFRVIAEWGFLVICEGELDALLLYQEGLPAISATNGVGSFNQELASTVKRRHQGTVVVSYDQDEPGRVNSIRVARLFGLQGKVARWPQEWGKDPSEALLRRPVEELILAYLTPESPKQIEGYWHNTLRNGVWR